MKKRIETRGGEKITYPVKQKRITEKKKKKGGRRKKELTCRR